MRVVRFSDVSFTKSRDPSTQLGYIVLLVDTHDNSAPLTFKLYKSRCITGFTMASEVIAFVDMSNAAVTLTEELGCLLNLRVPLQVPMNLKRFHELEAPF